jgi:hypothetical protein
MHDRHRAHGTRLQRDVQRAADQAVIPYRLSCAAHRHDLGMRAGIMLGDIEVPALAKNLPVSAHQHGPDRNLVELPLGAFGQCQRVAHPAFVGIVYGQALRHRCGPWPGTLRTPPASLH